MIRIYGTMTDPSGTPVPGAIIELRAINSTSEVLLGSTVTHKCDQQGAYNFQLATGTYDAHAQNDRCGDMDYLGTARVSANSIDGDLHSILIDGGITITSPILESALAAAQRAESAAALTEADQVSASQNAESAKADSAAAKTSSGEAISAASTAVFAKESIIADARDVRTLATQVSTQATDVTAKHGDVVVKAQQVSAQTDIVSSKHGEVVTKTVQASEDAAATQAAKNISVAAADTATQKAASAATHDASAQDAAARAENAASIVVGAVLDGGECDLSGGVYPQPITVAGKKYSTIWYVAVAGTVSDVTFDVGDLLRYTTAKTGYYFKIDAKDEVYSVNDEKGAVTVTPEKIGAERTGIAQQLMDQHSSKDGAHSISGVKGLLAALNEKYSPKNKPTAADVDAPTRSDFEIVRGDVNNIINWYEIFHANIAEGTYSRSLEWNKTTQTLTDYQKFDNYVILDRDGNKVGGRGGQATSVGYGIDFGLDVKEDYSARIYHADRDTGPLGVSKRTFIEGPSGGKRGMTLPAVISRRFDGVIPGNPSDNLWVCHYDDGYMEIGGTVFISNQVHGHWIPFPYTFDQLWSVQVTPYLDGAGRALSAEANNGINWWGNDGFQLCSGQGKNPCRFVWFARGIRNR